MPESENERNRAIVDALLSAVAEAVDRLAPEIEPALRYTLAPPSEAAPGHTEDTQ
jgi:hypothetical protein